MSVSSVGSSGPDPASYSYPATAVTVPQGDPPAPGPAATTSSPYVAEYAQLQTQDAAELLQVSFGSAADATSNVDSVLAQAAQLQAAQLAEQQNAAQTVANDAIQSASGNSSSSSSGTDPLASLPSFQSIIGASDTAANQAIDQYTQNLGNGIDTLV